jgi:hypothetical protein
MNDKQLDRKNKILVAILAAIAFISALGAVAWFTMYAPLILDK